jgi:hypothetical protein
MTGYFDADHLDELAQEAARLTPFAVGVYVTMNPVLPDLLARAANRVVRAGRAAKATSDDEILHRRRLTIDLDPERPAGISATDAEKDLAHDLGRRVYSDLRGRGWPEPLIADSGNGYHLNYGIDLPVDDDGLVERFLAAVAGKYSTDKVKVDPSLFTPSHIIKLYGTLSRKGDSIPSRPHRLSAVVSAPGRLEVVDRELIEAFVRDNPPPEPEPKAKVKPARRNAGGPRLSPATTTPNGDAVTWDKPAWVLRPGDDYNARADGLALMQKHGWTVDRELPNGEIRLTRPGKPGGTSATIGRTTFLHVFTGSIDAAPFEANGSYSKFEALTRLEYDGDHKAAARGAAKLGFGTFKDNDGTIRTNPPPPGWKRVPVGKARAASPGNDGKRGENTAASPVRDTGDDDDDSLPVAVPAWPEPPGKEAYYGILGQIAREIEPRTECDPLAILVHLVLSFGNVVGRSAYIQVESTRHYLNEFGVIVGRSALGRKGTAGDWAKEVYNRIDGVWTADRIQAGLSSGEGLISAVRDPTETRSPIREKGKIVDWQIVESDPGVSDKRLLVLETEFGGALRALEREGNKLSALIRQAWDSGHLRSLTKAVHKASDAHISILGHITPHELKSLLAQVDIVNGFANRFLWFAVKRQRELPFGGAPPDLQMHCDSLAMAVGFARTVGRIAWSPEARDLWKAMYGELAASLPSGPLGEVLSRCHPHVIRLAGIYTVADGTTAIGVDHLRAARDLWDASARCARYIFGDSLGDPLAEKILAALKASPSGLTRTQIRADVFQRHLASPRLQSALALLLERGAIREVAEKTDGRTAHRYFECRPAP